MKKLLGFSSLRRIGIRGIYPANSCIVHDVSAQSRSFAAVASSDRENFGNSVITNFKSKDFDKAVLLWEKHGASCTSSSEFLRSQAPETKFAAMVAYSRLRKPFKARDMASNLCDEGKYRLVPGQLLRAYCKADTIQHVEGMLLKWITMQPDSERDQVLASELRAVVD